MKNILKLLLGTFFTAAIALSCKKDENQVVYQGGTAPVLTANKTTIPLSFLTKDNEAVKFMWTNPEYKFNTGISSQNVNYIIEIDKNGANFGSAGKFSIAVSKDLSRSLTQGELNDVLLNKLLYTPGVARNVEVRVKSFLASNAVMLTSNVMIFLVTPFAIPPKVAPPASGTLFMVGNATPGGWNNPVPDPSQKFTQVSATLYELTVNISPGGSYLFLPVNGSWAAKYGFTGGNNANNVNGDDFKDGGGDMLAPAVAGNYKIQVDFQRGVFTVTKL